MINVYKQTIAGRTIALAFDLQAWVDVEEKFGSLQDLFDQLPKLDARFEMLAILARGGARRHPELSGDLNHDWLINNASPHELVELVNNASHNIADNMAGRETIAKDKPVDIFLEELNAKNAQS